MRVCVLERGCDFFVRQGLTGLFFSVSLGSPPDTGRDAAQ
jgi:hypothetical protein